MSTIEFATGSHSFIYFNGKILDKDLHDQASSPLTSKFLGPCSRTCQEKLLGEDLWDTFQFSKTLWSDCLEWHK